MRLNQKEIILHSFVSESIDDQMVLYNEVAQKVVVVNQSAAFIWNEIVDKYRQKTNLSTEEIAHLICKKYHLTDNSFLGVCDDIEDTIASFFEASLLSYSSET